MYISQQQYLTKGGTITDVTAFNRYEYKAAKKLDYYTQDRLHGVEEVPQAIQMLMVELIDLLYKADSVEGQITSVSNDGYSVSYAEQRTDEKAYALIHTYAAEYCARGINYG